MFMQSKKEFWVSNISNMNVTLADLALNIRARSSVNLLDNKHYKYTLEQLQASAEKGSLFKKRDKIYVRKLAPKILKSNLQFNRDSVIPGRERSVLEIKQNHYEELAITVSDEEFANELADMADVNEPIKK